MAPWGLIKAQLSASPARARAGAPPMPGSREPGPNLYDASNLGREAVERGASKGSKDETGVPLHNRLGVWSRVQTRRGYLCTQTVDILLL